MAKKTNAVRLIEQAGIPCREAFYDYDESDLSGIHAADAIGMPCRQVFKTLVTRNEKGNIYIFCIPVDCELDLKKAAKASDSKNICLVEVKELLSLTGYIRGGCSPVGMKKRYPSYFSDSCAQLEEIAVSAGERGHQMILPVNPLIDLINANLADICK